MIDDEDPDSLALARRIMLDVAQLTAARGEMGAALQLVVRRLKITELVAMERACELGVRLGLLVAVDPTHLGLGDQAKAMIARRKLQLRTYPPEQQPRKGPPRRFDRVLRSRRRGVRTEFKVFGDRRAALKAWCNAN